MKQVIFFLLLLFSLSLSAQSIITGYHSSSFILQSSSNASAFPQTKFVFGFPGLSNINISAALPMSLNDVLEKGLDDSLRINIPSISSSLTNYNLVSTSFRNQLIHFGLKLGAKKNVFVYVGDEIVVEGGLQFSDDFIKYFTIGNANFINQQMSFNSQKIEFTAYNSFYVGTSLKLNDDFVVGARIKVLNGISNLHTRKLNFGFYTDSNASAVYATTITSDVLIHTSGQGALTDSIEFDPMKNLGLALDLGMSYKFSDDLSASFALNDLGSINWHQSNNTSYTSDGELEFELVGLTQSSADPEDLDAQLETILDSLTNFIEIQEASGSYRTKLNPNLFLGVSYSLSSSHSFSFLYNRKKYIDKSLKIFSIGYQYKLREKFELLTSCQIIDGVSSLASGFVWSPGPLQLHLIFDNILMADIFDAKNFFIQMGLSFHFDLNNDNSNKKTYLYLNKLSRF